MSGMCRRLGMSAAAPSCSCSPTACALEMPSPSSQPDARTAREHAEALLAVPFGPDSRWEAEARTVIDALLAQVERLEQEAGRLEPPYAQVVAGSAAVLLTAEQIDLILHFFRDVSVAETMACSITAEMHRARNALLAAREEETT